MNICTLVNIREFCWGRKWAGSGKLEGGDGGAFSFWLVVFVGSFCCL